MRALLREILVFKGTFFCVRVLILVIAVILRWILVWWWFCFTVSRLYLAFVFLSSPQHFTCALFFFFFNHVFLGWNSWPKTERRNILNYCDMEIWSQAMHVASTEKIEVFWTRIAPLLSGRHRGETSQAQDRTNDFHHTVFMAFGQSSNKSFAWRWKPKMPAVHLCPRSDSRAFPHHPMPKLKRWATPNHTMAKVRKNQLHRETKHEFT